MNCRHCGQRRGHWAGCPALTCPRCRGDGILLETERAATPDEVDAGCELGVTWDECPECRMIPDPARPERKVS